jgi:hypothetical protein
MDPRLIEIRSKKRQKKIPSDPTTDFEKAILMNPFAQMLASPARMDSISEARVPLAFLRPFTLRRDPDSDSVWQLPKDLDPEPLGAVDVSQMTSSEPEQESQGVSAGEEIFPSGERGLATCWVASTHPAMHHMSRGARSKRDLLKRRSLVTTTPRWRTLPKHIISKMTTKPDHATFIHELLRKRCAKQLVSLAGKLRYQEAVLIAPWPHSVNNAQEAVDSIEQSLRARSPTETPASLQNGILLWLGSEKVEPSQLALQKEGLFGNSESPIHDPLIRLSCGRAVPVLDVETLLGADHIAWLRLQDPMFQQVALIVKQSPISLNAIMWLWKLHVY